MEERKKNLLTLFGIAVLIHLGLIVSKWFAILVGVAGLAALLMVLWKATTGRRMGLKVALLAATIAHGIGGGVAYYLDLGAEDEEVVQIRFKAPPPILHKSFDLAKQPEIAEVEMQMLASLGPPRIPSDIPVAEVSMVGSDLLGTFLRGSQAGGGFGGAKAEKFAFDDVEMIQLAETAVPVQEATSLRRELLNVADLDYGRFQAVLVQDPENKKNIRGFFNMTIVDYDLADKSADRFPTAVEELMRYTRDHTRINARIEGTTVRLSDTHIMKAPFIYMTGNSAILQLTRTEKENLGEYLRNGGFLYAEEIRKSNAGGLDGQEAGVFGTLFDRQFKALMKEPEVLGTAGSRWRKVDKSHPLFYSFFDFADGPPMGGAPGGNVFDLEMLEVRGRVAVVFSDLNISWYWGDQNAEARERGLQFGVNLIVYALTQPGGIANVTQFSQ